MVGLGVPFIAKKTSVLFCGSVLRGAGYSQKKFGGGVGPASQNSYPIYDENLPFSLPYL